MNEKLKSFLLYGIENKIERKEIYEMDGVILFFSFFLFILCEEYMVRKILCILLASCFIISTFSLKDVSGKRIFWIYGIWSLGLSILFGSFGTILMMSTIEERHHSKYLVILSIVYVIILLIFIIGIIYLIKKGAYDSVPVKKMAGGWCFLLFGMCGIFVAKILKSSLSEDTLIQIGAVCFYLVSFMSMLGCFSFVKYLLLKKYHMEV